VNKFLFCLTAAVSVSLAQQNPLPVHSPEVHSDGRVTFRLRAQNAQKVVVHLEGTKDPLVMQKDQEGVWTITTDPLTPEIYGYSFDADGVHLLDSYNTEIKPNLLGLSNVVHVTGTQPEAWEVSDIPHGIVHHHFYKSAIVGDNRDFYVYTPPGYDSKGSTLYPVLYLLHGYSDDAGGWTAVGKANLILDSLIAQGKAKPMIVVMPLGYGAPEIVQRTSQFGAPFRNAELRERNFSKFRSALIDEVIPAVERMYKADGNREARAITGLSMGGAESLFTGLNRLDKFSWVGAFSSGGFSGDFAANFPQLTASANSQLHLLWVACGTEDGLITANRNLVTWLKGKDIHLTQIETPGMHTWMVWRRNLTDFAPLLFRANGAVNTSPTETAKK
jgi:enterochelin esterase-like enzyme